MLTLDERRKANARQWVEEWRFHRTELADGTRSDAMPKELWNLVDDFAAPNWYGNQTLAGWYDNDHVCVHGSRGLINDLHGLALIVLANAPRAQKHQIQWSDDHCLVAFDYTFWTTPPGMANRGHPIDEEGQWICRRVVVWNTKNSKPWLLLEAHLAGWYVTIDGERQQVDWTGPDPPAYSEDLNMDRDALTYFIELARDVRSLER